MLYRLQPRVKNFDHNRIEIIALTSCVRGYVSLDSSNRMFVQKNPSWFRLCHLFKSVTFTITLQTCTENISISIPKGKTTAFVGYSGAGKSTPINFPVYDVTEGEIYVDGYPCES